MKQGAVILIGTVAASRERTAWRESMETTAQRVLGNDRGRRVFAGRRPVAALIWVNLDASSYESVWADKTFHRLGGRIAWTLIFGVG